MIIGDEGAIGYNAHVFMCVCVCVHRSNPTKYVPHCEAFCLIRRFAFVFRHVLCSVRVCLSFLCLFSSLLATTGHHITMHTCSCVCICVHVCAEGAYTYVCAIHVVKSRRCSEESEGV